MKVTKEMLEALARGIAATRPEEIDCDEWLSRVGRLLEIMQREEPIPPDLEPVLQHLEQCPECNEELQLLLAALDESD